MKFINLRNQLETHKIIDTDLCIIGSGAAGAYLSFICSKHFRNMIVLEAGDLNSSTSKVFNESVIFEKEKYSGAITGRSFGIGGSTSLWGGLLAPYSNIDVSNNNSHSGSRFKTILKSVENHSSSVLKNLGYRSENYFSIITIPNYAINLLNNVGITLKSSLTIPFSKRNFRWMFYRENSRDSSSLIFYNSTVINCKFLESNTSKLLIQSIEAISDNGKKLTVQAKKIVVANGAIESTRMLLEFKESAQRCGFRIPETDLGKYLGDHISASIANLVYDKKNYLVKFFFPIFIKNWMQSFRFTLKGVDELPRHFFYLQVVTDGRGVQIIRRILQFLQSGVWSKVNLIDLILGSAQIFKFAIFRYFYNRLYVQKGSIIKVQLDMEQNITIMNHICLSDIHRDKFGRKKIHIDWKISEIDVLHIKELGNMFINKWNSLPKIFPRLKRVNGKLDLISPFDIYHPVGTCRLGSDLRSVVDETSLKVRGYDNVYLLSTSLFPSAGTSNPTFSLLCLAHLILLKIKSDAES